VDQRYYAVGTGRFNTADPSTGVDRTNPATWNKYAYVVGDPVYSTDRKGLFYCQDCIEPDEPPEEDPGPGSPLPEPPRPTPEPPPPIEPGGGGHNPCNDTTDVNFVKAYLSDAQTLAAKLDVPAEWVLAVGSTESTYGTSDIAKFLWNPLG